MRPLWLFSLLLLVVFAVVGSQPWRRAAQEETEGGDIDKVILEVGCRGPRGILVTVINLTGLQTLIEGSMQRS